MKFKVSTRDFTIFILFCIFLLYLCAIGVLNFASFGQTGEFYGLSPFKAFSSEYLPATIILFIIVMIIIFTSVSSYIFSKDKGGGGFGFAFGEKDNKGYNRWATDREIKYDKGVDRVFIKDAEAKSAGIPLINNGRVAWVDNGEYHNLVVGATGSGKTETIVKPMVNLLAKKGESMIIMDPKGEIYKYSGEYLKEHGYNIKILNFRDPHYGSAWNPLTLPYQYMQSGNRDKSIELLEDVALNILYDPSNKQDGGFWEKSAADYFSALVLGLFEDAEEDAVNISSVNLMGAVGEEKFAASNYSKEYFGLKGEQSNAYVFASNTINAPTETKGGILSVFRQKIRQFASKEDLSEMLSHSDFNISDIGKGKTAIFIVIHDEKTTYHGLATIFIKQCYECLVDEAQKNGGKLPIRTNFILDEFANMPPLKDVDAMVTAARSRDIRFTFIVQNFGQLKDVYGDKAGTIKGNCGNTVYLISTELASLEEISKMAGEVKSDEKDKTASTPLVTVSDLQKLKLFEAIIIRWRMPPFKTKFEPDYKIDWGINRVPAEFIERTTAGIKTFDLKEFVKEEKRKKLFDSLDNNKPGEINDLEMPKSNIPPAFGGMPGMDLPPMSGKSGVGLPGDYDIDAMIKSIDEKIAELDAEEERKRKELENARKVPEVEEPVDPVVTSIPEEPVMPVQQIPEPTITKPIDDLKRDFNGGYNIYNTNTLEPDVKEDDLVVDEPSSAIPKDIPNINAYNKIMSEVEEINSKYKLESVKEEVSEEPAGKFVIPADKPQIDLAAFEVPDEDSNDKKDKPKVRVDTESVIVDEHAVTDDEFFDEFFGED